MGSAFSYKCVTYKQRPKIKECPRFCLFAAPVGEVLRWADIHRLEETTDGAQRGINDTKVRSVARYLDDKSNTIPTAVIVGLNIPDRAIKRGNDDTPDFIRISVRKGTEKPGTVIDGQHRLLGMNAHDPDLLVNVVALLTDNSDEVAFNFLVINNKAAKVKTDHIKALLFERDDERLKERIRKARLSVSATYGFVGIADQDEESPFFQMVDWPINRGGSKIIAPAAIEDAIKGLQSRSLPELEDDDSLIEVFFTIWRTIKASWPKLWSAKSKLLEKVGIVCMSEYIVNSIVASYDIGELCISNIDEVDERVRTLLSMQKPDLWQMEWPSKSLDTQAGRKLVVDSLVQVARNIRQKIEWKSDILVLNSK